MLATGLQHVPKPALASMGGCEGGGCVTVQGSRGSSPQEVAGNLSSCFILYQPLCLGQSCFFSTCLGIPFTFFPFLP